MTPESMSDPKMGDIVRFKKAKGVSQYCMEGTLLRVIGIEKEDTAGNLPTFMCQIIIGAWGADYDHWPLDEKAMFYSEELEKIHDP